MHEQPVPPYGRRDPLDDLVTRLLDCGGVLSQVIASMYEFQAGGHSAPEAAPIPEVAHSLVRDVSDGVRTRHSVRDIEVAGSIVKEVTDAICENLYVVGPELD